jgi:DNA-binding MurR/RpiR family transcriptional regulator
VHTQDTFAIQRAEPIQKTLADYIASSREELPTLDMKQLAKRARVTLATVTRFWRAIGFGSFHEFKIASTQELASVRPDFRRPQAGPGPLRIEHSTDPSRLH